MSNGDLGAERRLPLEAIRPRIRAMSAYTLAPIDAPVKINQNENPFGMPAEIRDEVMRRVMSLDWARYPDFEPTRLIEKLAKYSGWRADGVMAGNGSNEMIQSVIHASIEPGRVALIPEPTFSIYRQVVTVAGGEMISVPLRSDLGFDIERLGAAISEHQPTMTIICSPNNPTGCTISHDDLVGLLRLANGLIVVDQAYLEIGGEDFRPLLDAHPNLVILRTFSKAMAMGGLRVGYCLASPELTREFNKARMPYSLNIFSMTAAEVALERRDLLRPLVEAMAAERDRLFNELRQIDGLRPIPSAANFFAVETSLPPQRVFAELLNRGFLIRDVSKSPMLSGFVRISVGTPDENDGLIAALREIFSVESRRRAG